MTLFLCPVCHNQWFTSSTAPVVTCPHCQTELEVVRIVTASDTAKEAGNE